MQQSSPHVDRAVGSLQATWAECYLAHTGTEFKPNTRHVCTALCQWYRRSETPGLSLCNASGLVHVCGIGVCNCVVEDAPVGLVDDSGGRGIKAPPDPGGGDKELKAPFGPSTREREIKTPVCALTGRVLRGRGTSEAWKLRVEWMRDNLPLLRSRKNPNYSNHICTPACGWVKRGDLYCCKITGLVHKCGPGECSHVTDPSRTYATRSGNAHQECNPGMLLCGITGQEVCGNISQKPGFKDLGNTHVEDTEEEEEEGDEIVLFESGKRKRSGRKRKRKRQDPVGSSIDVVIANRFCKTRFVDEYQPDEDAFDQLAKFCGIVRVMMDNQNLKLLTDKEQTTASIIHFFLDLQRVPTYKDSMKRILSNHKWASHLSLLTNAKHGKLRQAKKFVSNHREKILNHFDTFYRFDSN